LTREIIFAGGPNSAFHPHGAYIDAPLHRECMRYAMRVCPYLAAPTRREYLNQRAVDKISERLKQVTIIDPTLMPDRPEMFVSVMSYGRRLVPCLSGGPNPYQRPYKPYRGIEFWRHGGELSFADGVERLRAIRGLDLRALSLLL